VNKVITITLSLIYIGISFVDGFNVRYIINHCEGDQHHDLCIGYHFIAFVFIPPFVLVSIAIYLTVAAIYLNCQIRTHFKKRLISESRRIQTIYIVFATSYLLRAAFFLFQTTPILSDKTVYKIASGLYILFDIAPLVLIMVYHKICFVIEKSEEVQDSRHYAPSTTSAGSSISGRGAAATQTTYRTNGTGETSEEDSLYESVMLES